MTIVHVRMKFPILSRLPHENLIKSDGRQVVDRLAHFIYKSIAWNSNLLQMPMMDAPTVKLKLQSIALT